MTQTQHSLIALEGRIGHDIGDFCDRLIDRANAAGTDPEIWKPVPEFEGLYEVSSLGRIKTLGDRHGRVKPLVFSSDRDGYPLVLLTKNGRRVGKVVHRLVAMAFHGDKRNALHKEVAHLDGNRRNNRADNLKWVSRGENMSHKRAHGTAHGCKGNHLRLTLDQAREIVAAKGRKTRRELSEEYGLHPASISQIWTGARWKAAHPISQVPSQEKEAGGQ